MEVLNSSSSSDQIQTITRRKRHRKVKPSNLSERLKPDFDPIDAIQQASAPKPKPHIEEKSIQDVDSLVKCYPKIIHDYLLKVLKFLQSDLKELRFPDIAPFKEEFLVKIAQNNSLLDTVKFWDESSVQTAKQILQLVYQNRYVFKWKCKYEEEKENKNVLVYEKVTVNKSQSKKDKILCSTGSTSSIEKGLKIMSLNDGQPEMTPGFKITMLNTTLKFIKDPTRLTLEYPAMSLPQAQYLHNLIQPGVDQKNGDLGYGFKSMYSVLHETMDKLKDKYQFQISFKKNTSDSNTTKLVLNKLLKKQTLKTPKASKRKINCDSKSLNSSFTSTSSTDSKSRRPRRDCHTIYQQRILAKLSVIFLTSTLQKFLKFIEDKTMASLEFKAVDVTESRFLESLITLSRLEDYYCLFSPECEVMLKRISRSLRRKDWRLTLNVGKLCKRTVTRTIVFYKSPSYESKTVESQPTTKSPKAETTNKAVKLSNDLTVTVKNDQGQNDAKIASNNLPSTSKSQNSRKPIAFLNAGSLNKESLIDNKTNMTQSEESKLNQSGSNDNQSGSDVTESGSNPTQSGSNEAQNGSNVNQSVSNMTQSESSQNGPNVTQNGSNMTQNASSPPLASRKARLLKALTTPMECDRAERMMRMMGWEGGGLGLRGEGITEPILPAIHIAPGAGLGHVKTPVHNTAAEFRIKFLHDLLNFIKSSTSETEVTFPQPMTKRECSFVNHTMPVFNDRRTIGLNAPEEMDLVFKINEEFLNDLHLYVTCDVSEDKKTLHLKKENGPKFSKKGLKKKKRSKSKNKSNTDDVTSNDDVIDISETTKDIESICPTRKAAQNLAYRIKFLEKVKEFLTNQDEVVEHKYDCVINKKLGTYFENVIKDINRNIATTRFSEIENDLFREIRRNSNGCYMNVTYKEQKFTLVKRFPKNQVNPTHSLPPPKSKDLKNTIIYQNNVAIPADKYEDQLKNNINDDGHETDEDYEKHAKDKENYDKHAKDNEDYEKHAKDKKDYEKHAKDKENYEKHAKDNEDYEKHAKDKKDYEKHAKDKENYEKHAKDNEDYKKHAIDKENYENHAKDKGAKTFIDSIKNATNKGTIDVAVQVNNEIDSSKTEINNDQDYETDVPQEEYDTSKDICLDISNDSLMLDVESLDAKVIENKKFEHDLGEVNNNQDFKDKNGGEYRVNENKNNDILLENINSVDNTRQELKKLEIIKYVSIASKDDKSISIDLVKLVQTKISDVIATMDDEILLPLLKCHGVRNGELIYSCHNEYSYYWLKNINEFFDKEVEIHDTEYSENSFKLRMRINSFINGGVTFVFNRLNLYNPGLDSKEWKVLNETKTENFVQYDLSVDEKSFNFVSENGFSLFVGIDKAQFSILWD